MSVVSVKRIKEPGSRSGTSNQLWQRTYKEIWHVVFDNCESGPATIYQGVTDPNTGAKLPAVGNSYFVTTVESDNYSFVQTLNPRFKGALANNQGLWEVEIDYGPYDPAEFPQNPVDWPLIMWWGSHKYEKPIEEDINGDAIVNSAKDKFADPILIDDSRPVLYVQRNEPVHGFDPLLADNLRDNINSVDWVHGTGASQIVFPQFAVKFSDRTMDKPVKNPVDGTYYYQCVYAFEFDKSKWKVFPLDQGFAFLDTSSPPNRVKLLDKDGQPYSEPVLLNGSGEINPTNAAAVFLEFDVYPEVDFAIFNMDLSKALGM